MTITTNISTKELKRVAAEAYEGKTLAVMLCNVNLTGYTEENTIAEWQTVERSSSYGYVRFTQTIGVGSYDSVAGRYQLPVIDAAFTANGGPLTYDRVVLYISDGIATYPHSVIVESPNIILQDGQTQTYRIDLNTDTF